MWKTRWNGSWSMLRRPDGSDAAAEGRLPAEAESAVPGRQAVVLLPDEMQDAGHSEGRGRYYHGRTASTQVTQLRSPILSYSLHGVPEVMGPCKAQSPERGHRVRWQRRVSWSTASTLPRVESNHITLFAIFVFARLVLGTAFSLKRLVRAVDCGKSCKEARMVLKRHRLKDQVCAFVFAKYIDKYYVYDTKTTCCGESAGKKTERDYVDRNACPNINSHGMLRFLRGTWNVRLTENACGTHCSVRNLWYKTCMWSCMLSNSWQTVKLVLSDDCEFGRGDKAIGSVWVGSTQNEKWRGRLFCHFLSV